jgi:xanthine dehydrogenase accessory factor
MNDHLDVFNRATELRRDGVPFALCTVTWSQRPASARTGAKAVVTLDGAIFGWIGGACSQPSVIRHAREAIEQGEPRTIRLTPDGDTGTARDGLVMLAMTCHSGGTLEIFIEPFQPEPYLIAIGETPVAHSLLAIGRHLGFRTVAMGSTTADADEHFPDLAFGQLQPGRTPFVVVASMGSMDEDALQQALQIDAPYVALVGSRRRYAAVVDYLRYREVPQEDIDRVHAPAGLDIHAETPAEIALSILAEITEVRRKMPVRVPQPVAEAVAHRMVVDPICGMEVDLDSTRFTLEHNGEVIGFCCPACMREYERRAATS